MAALKDILMRFSGIIAGLILLPFVLPFILIARLYYWLFVPFIDCPPAEVAENLKSILAGDLSEDPWDDLENTPIREPRLAAIRKEALAVSEPIDDAGRSVLAALLLRTEELAKEASVAKSID